jgi:hypothetical protein
MSTADAAQKKLTPALRELSKAEDTADAYLNKWGANFGQMLRDVVTINPPDEVTPMEDAENSVIFDTKLDARKKSIPYSP